MISETPARYAGTGITCIDAMESMQAASGITDPRALWWWGCAFKYLWRWWGKDGAEDLGKAIDCMERLRELYGEANTAHAEPGKSPHPCRAMRTGHERDKGGAYIGGYMCSACGADAWADRDSITPYCPMCGSKVEKVDE